MSSRCTHSRPASIPGKTLLEASASQGEAGGEGRVARRQMFKHTLRIHPGAAAAAAPMEAKEFRSDRDSELSAHV